ncbi:MAG: hypothetical protein IJ064_06170 [Bacteroidaceae bacterium]|nr:hypothetical protein [Bacteroidaceae bacterium]
MKASDDIRLKDDAFRQAMLRRKAQRPMMEFPKDLEDRVMERIYASPLTSGTTIARRGKTVRLWIIRAAGVAAVVTGVVFLVGTLRPTERETVSPKVVAKAEVHTPAEPETKKELPQTAEVRTSPIPRMRPQPKAREDVAVKRAEDGAIAKAVEDVCINCELDAMSRELTAMIDGFENQ